MGWRLLSLSLSTLVLLGLLSAGLLVGLRATAHAGTRKAAAPAAPTDTNPPNSPKGKPLPNDPTVTTDTPVCGDQDGSETPFVRNCSSYSLVTDRRYYVVPGTGLTAVHFDYVYKSAGCHNELAVFKVDDVNGSINGVLPGDPSWPTQVASRNPRYVFSLNPDAFTPDVDLTFQGGEILAFLFNGCTAGRSYYSYEQANPDGFDHLLMYQNTAGEPWQLAWEDNDGGGDKDFNDMVVNVSKSTAPPILDQQTDGNCVGLIALCRGTKRGDDVNTLTGTFTTSATDLTEASIGLSFAFGRTYNSDDPTVGRLGPGWADSYSASLLVQANGDVILHAEDGQQVYYQKQPDGSFVGAAGARASLSTNAGGYQLVRHDQVTYQFNSSGVLQSELDRNGKGLTFGYSGSLLSTITDSAGHVINLGYWPSNLLKTVTTPDQRVVTYGYDGSGRLSNVTLPDPDGGGPLTSPVTQYTYDPVTGKLQSEIDANNHTVFTNTYDASTGRVTQQVYPTSATPLTFSWDAPSQTTTITDQNSHQWKDIYESQVLQKEQAGNGDTTTFAHDPDLNVNSVTAPNNTDKTTLVYQNGNLTSATAPSSLGSNVKKQFTYDAQNNVKTVTDALNNLTTYGYDPSGNLTSITINSTTQIYGAVYVNGLMQSSTDGNGKTTSYTYDASGNLASVTTPDPDGNGPLQAATTTYPSYNALGEVLTKVSPKGNVAGCGCAAQYTTTYTYDAEGRSTQMTAPDPDGAGPLLAPVTKYTYDAAGNLKTVTDANNHVTTFDYDNANHLIKVTAPDPDGNGPLTSPVTNYCYDAVGNRVAMVDPRGNPPGASCASSFTTTYGYDSNNRLQSVTTPKGEKTTYTYDQNGNLKTVVDPRGNVSGCNCAAQYTTTNLYDAAGRLTKVTAPDPDGTGGSLPAPVTTYTYDNVGNLKTMVAPKGNDPGCGCAAQYTTTYNLYDAQGRLLKLTAPDGGITQYTYDGNGSLKTRTDDNGHVTTWDYYDDGHLKQITGQDPDAGGPLTAPITTFSYDPNGNQTIKVDPNGNAGGNGTTTNSYDNDDRLTGISYSGTGTPNVTYGYDPVGNRTSMTDGSGSVSYFYDNDNRLTSLTRVGTNPFSYEYDPAGNITKRTYPDTTQIIYGYDEDNRLASLASGGATTSYGYDPASHLTQTTFPSGNGYTETRTYDNAGRLTELKTANATSTLADYVATLDSDGNPTQIVRTGNTSLTSTYTYDPNDRLLSVCFKASCQPGDNVLTSWTYDKVGNRKTETTSSGTTNYTYDGLDELTQAGTTPYTYDHNGNQKMAGTNSYLYDLANRLTSITTNTTSTYIYDGDGNRLRTTKGTAQTNFLWDTNQPLAQLALERDGSNNLLRRYLYGSDLVSMSTPSATVYYHPDTIGSIGNITSTSGASEWTYTYKPFGNIKQSTKNDTSAPTNLINFAGEYLDPTGLYYLRARQYDPGIVRFLQVDRARPARTDPYVATYVFVRDQPTVLTDPSGMTGQRLLADTTGRDAAALPDALAGCSYIPPVLRGCTYEGQVDYPHFSSTAFNKTPPGYEYVVKARWFWQGPSGVTARLTLWLQRLTSNGDWVNLGAPTIEVVPPKETIVKASPCVPGTTSTLRGVLDVDVLGWKDPANKNYGPDENGLDVPCGRLTPP